MNKLICDITVVIQHFVQTANINGKTNGVNVVLLYYEDNEYKGGYRCRCPELDAWGESIGMFQNK